MKYSVYVLKSLKDGRYYIGCTSDLEVRIKAHQSGKVRSTKGRRPFKLSYFETYETSTEARKRENFFKSGQGRKFLNVMLSNTEG